MRRVWVTSRDNRSERAGWRRRLSESLAGVGELARHPRLADGGDLAAHIRFLSVAQPGDLHAEAQLLRLGRRLAGCDVRLWTEGPERLAAQANVTYAIPA